MTEIQSDEERKRVMLYEIHGIDQEDCAAIIEQHIDNTRKLDNAEDKVRRARDIVDLLMDADAGNTAGDYDLSCRVYYSLKRAQSLLKSAAKKIDKYGDEQRWRDVENWKQGGAS